MRFTLGLLMLAASLAAQVAIDPPPPLPHVSHGVSLEDVRCLECGAEVPLNVMPIPQTLDLPAQVPPPAKPAKRKQRHIVHKSPAPRTER